MRHERRNGSRSTVYGSRFSVEKPETPSRPWEPWTANREPWTANRGPRTNIMPSLTYDATIERIVEIAPETRCFFLRLPAAVRFSFVPGQFISCLLPVGGETLIRPYTIASHPEDAGVLEICLNRVPDGPGSSYLFDQHVGAG